MLICSTCGTSNDEGLKFCVACGATLAPDPGAWRAGTGELNQQTPSASSIPPSPYAPPPVPTYDTPSGALAGGSSAQQMNYALWADRVIAALIDAGLALALMIVLYIVLILLTGVLSAGAGAISKDAGGLLGCSGCCMWFVLPPVSYFVMGLLNKVYWVSTRGHSIGQGMMKLKVVNAQGGLLSMSTAIIRLLATVGLAFVPIVGAFLDLLWPLWDPQRQTLHDKAVGSFVIKTE